MFQKSSVSYPYSMKCRGHHPGYVNDGDFEKALKKLAVFFKAAIKNITIKDFE